MSTRAKLEIYDLDDKVGEDVGYLSRNGRLYDATRIALYHGINAYHHRQEGNVIHLFAERGTALGRIVIVDRTTT